jgi:uncharacterized protein (TIGR00255 family)
MLLSMTGFGSVSKEIEFTGGKSSTLSIEIKSLNSRFLEINSKICSSLSSLEIPISALAKKRLLRGKIFVLVKFIGNDPFEEILLSSKTVKNYIDPIRALKKELNIAGELSISDIFSLPNIFQTERTEISKMDKETILVVADEAIENLLGSRRKEGESIEKDLVKIFEFCQKRLSCLKNLFDKFMTQKKDELKELIKKVNDGDQESESKIGECYDLINKIDINEEIVRFENHLSFAKTFIRDDSSIEKGKRFEFLQQELYREINTIGAKCSNSEISAIAVDLKVELEKIREQVQNSV